MLSLRSGILGVIFTLVFASLGIAGSVTNEGSSPVKLSIKTNQGITGGGTLRPGQTVPLRNNFLWLEHIPEGPSQEVRIKIAEDNGTTTYITSIGGRYTRPQTQNIVSAPAASFMPSKVKLQPGYVTNNSNVQIYVTFIGGRLGAQRTQVLLPSQTLTVPEDTVEVKTQPLNSSFRDATFFIEVLMPDGTRQSIQSAQGSVYTKQRGN